MKQIEDLLGKALPPRSFDSRKGQNGIVAVIGGSRIYHGAPTLAGLAAYRTGVDLVYLFVPEPISVPVRAMSPSLIVYPLPDYKITLGCANKILSWMPKVDACVIGPGAGKQRPEGLKKLAIELSLSKVKLVIDADALQPEIVTDLPGKDVILTPHPGEFKRISGIELTDSLEERKETVKKVAKSLGVTILVKGHADIISDGERIAVDGAGSPAMTVGGVGDVLSGILAALLSKGIEPFTSAVLGAYINGKCGELAAEKFGMRILPTDLIGEIPNILKKHDKISRNE
ncbi:MAG: NAD(P)H-hydrate dehydratase [Thaumarchaeota archaeon]|nr:NAD(P)H-hydrate dehydratase [Nitrososphaerota archaeon]